VSESEPKIYPYGPLLRVAPGLFSVKGKWKRSPLGRRMTIVQLADGRLAIHSAMRLKIADLEAIEHLGEVSWILIPNRFHHSDAPWFARRYPGARVLVPRALSRKLARRIRVDGTLEDDWPAELGAELEGLTVGGLSIHEVVFHHAASQTLILTDLAFNFRSSELEGTAKLFMKLNGAVNRFGPTRLLRFMFVRDRVALTASIAKILSWNFERVIVSHGQILDNTGREKMHRAFKFLPDLPPLEL
jgi:hypothetical protein